MFYSFFSTLFYVPSFYTALSNEQIDTSLQKVMNEMKKKEKTDGKMFNFLFLRKMDLV